ncbi:glucosyl transferase [Sulfitobacter alexandrii]|uniref:Glucosyl transferase n=1 Tax=Sulfitobacter alexandrii TaxID=1917485 RepID=A0A1J0WDL8_9RHOB|nr:glycosyltransferase [Sulfitobacter alexandrii]APE42415.1 glucosyl transferase [Sulfitobacter alexandrii]
MPLFSIILPCFNAEATITDTLASLSAQSFADWEAICVDDGSTDATAFLVRKAARRDPRIRLVSNTGKGPSDARNMGALACASGDLLAFCDADDLFVPGKLSHLRDILSDRSIDAVFGRIGFFQSVPGDSGVFSTVPARDLTIDMLLGENPVCTMSNITVRRGVFERSGGFDPAMVHNEDLDWLIRLVGLGARVVGVDLLHTWYRTSPGGLSTDLDAMLAGRARAVETAASFGVRPSNRSHAIHHRYLARRALRMADSRTAPLRHTVHGMIRSPAGFLCPPRRGVPTFLGALAALLLPRAFRQSLFS